MYSREKEAACSVGQVGAKVCMHAIIPMHLSEVCAFCVFSCHVQRKHITDYILCMHPGICISPHNHVLLVMRHMRLKCARYNCMVIFA